MGSGLPASYLQITTRWLAPVIWSCFLLWLLRASLRFIDYVWWKPRRLGLLMEKQGVRGPPPRLLFGNLIEMRKMLEVGLEEEVGEFKHDLLEALMPDYAHWCKLYGKQHLTWWGPEPRISVTNMEMLREIFSQKHALSWGKPLLVQKFLEPVTGMGLALANGEEWAYRRRVLGPAFHFEKLKGLEETMVKCTEEMLEEWLQRATRDGSGRAEIEVGEEMRKLTADIIAHTQFGSSYERGKRIFADLDDLRNFVFRYGHYAIFPGSRFIPSSMFRKMWKLRRNVEFSVSKIIQERKNAVESGESTSYGSDLLGLMLAENEEPAQDPKNKRKKMSGFTVQQIVDECKTFFFAGHDTTAQLLTWSMLLLANNPLWQDRARTEVENLCQSRPPNTDCISRMKHLEMILYETLRLYPAVTGVVREAMVDMNVGDIFVPRGVSFVIPILAIHSNRELWGDDAYEFKPERFVNGIGKACNHPLGFMPFTYGPRSCIGQNFAMMEAKIALAMILSQFKLHPSTNYRHAPKAIVTVRPKYGAQIVFETLAKIL